MIQPLTAYSNLGAQKVAEWEQASMANVGYIFEAGFTDSTTPFSVHPILSRGVRKPKPLWRLK